MFRFSLVLAGCLAASVATAAPTLLFSDLTSGPSSGNSDDSRPGQVAGQDGAIVTVWGRGLGDSQGSSQVLVGGQPARVYGWRRATSPADLWTRLRIQMVEFQVPHTVAPGPVSVVVQVNGETSNSLPFTVRTGVIRFVRTHGHDDTGDGTWQNAWRTLDNLAGTGALEKIGVGDIVYVGDGVTHRDPAGDRAAIDLSAAGTAAAPKAIVGYPGATASIGDSTQQKAYSLWVSGYGPTRGWVVAKLHLTAFENALGMNTDFRAVGNRITAPRGDGPTGAVAGLGDNLYLLGNELTNIGFPGTSKLYHPIYLQSTEACSGPRLPTERNREVAWNDLHHNAAYDGINIYRECGSSAYMVDHRVHDNFILSQVGDGIRIGDYVTGENWIYNNIVVDAGLGPDPPTEEAMHVPLHVHAGWEGTTTLIHVYNNTIVGGGWTGGAAWASSMVGFGTSHPWALDFRNNVIVSTVSGVGYLNASLDEPPGGVAHNLWWGAGGAPTWDADPLASAPLFVNPAAHDYSPQANSPLIDASVPTVPTAALPVPATDFYSNPRVGTGADLGAIEFPGAPSAGVEPPPAVSRLAVWPNPAHGAISLRLPDRDSNSPVRVLDPGGRIVRQFVPGGATITIPTESLRPGVYLVQYRGRTSRIAVVR